MRGKWGGIYCFFNTEQACCCSGAFHSLSRLREAPVPSGISPDTGLMWELKSWQEGCMLCPLRMRSACAMAFLNSMRDHGNYCTQWCRICLLSYWIYTGRPGIFLGIIHTGEHTEKEVSSPGISARAWYCVQKEPDTVCIVREFGLRGANGDAVTGHCRHNDLYFQSGLIIVQAIKHK